MIWVMIAHYMNMCVFQLTLCGLWNCLLECDLLPRCSSGSSISLNVIHINLTRRGGLFNEAHELFLIMALGLKCGIHFSSHPADSEQHDA